MLIWNEQLNSNAVLGKRSRNYCQMEDLSLKLNKLIGEQKMNRSVNTEYDRLAL